jgi:hypothetical protein
MNNLRTMTLMVSLTLMLVFIGAALSGKSSRSLGGMKRADSANYII